MRCRRVRFTRTKRVGYCWIGRCLFISGSAENRGNSCHLTISQRPRKHRCSDPRPRPELYLLNAAAQTRMVSVAKIRWIPPNLRDFSEPTAHIAG